MTSLKSCRLPDNVNSIIHLVRRRVKKKRLLARSLMGFKVEQPDGTAWGVLVLDSKQSHINGKRIGEEFRDLWRRSLRHMVAEL